VILNVETTDVAGDAKKTQDLCELNTQICDCLKGIENGYGRKF